MKQATVVPKSFLAKTVLDNALNDAYRAGKAAAEGGIYPDEEQCPTTDEIFDLIMEIMEVKV
jgi:hypothetical protein